MTTAYNFTAYNFIV